MQDISYAIALDSEDNVYAVGYGTNLVGGKGQDWWIKKFDKDGRELDFGGSGLPASGGGFSPCTTNGLDLVFNSGSNSGDVITAIVTDADDNLFVIGFGDNLVGASSDLDWWIKKFDKNGIEDTMNWDKSFDSSGGATGTYDDRAYAAAIDASGNIYIVGEGWDLMSDTSRSDWWLKKFDKNGNEDTTNWDKKYDGGTDGNETAHSVAVDSAGNVYVAGYVATLGTDPSGDDWWVKKYDSAGVEDTSWEKKLDGNAGGDRSCCVAVDSDDSVYVAGYGSDLYDASSSYDLWVQKLLGD
jgi:hypothetical protein